MNKKFKKRVAIFSAAISLCSFFTPLNEAKSDEIDTVTRNFSYAVAQDSSDPSQLNLYKVSAAGAATLIEANLFPDGGPGNFSASDMAVDNVLGKIYFREPPSVIILLVPESQDVPLEDTHFFEILSLVMSGMPIKTG